MIWYQEKIFLHLWKLRYKIAECMWHKIDYISLFLFGFYCHLSTSTAVTNQGRGGEVGGMWHDILSIIGFALFWLLSRVNG